MKRIVDFVAKYGNGKNGLTKVQKKNRADKLLGDEANKLKGFGTNPEIGIEPFHPGESISLKFIPDEIAVKIDQFPVSPRSSDGKNKILNIIINDDGSAIEEGVGVNDGTIQGIYSIYIEGDELSAASEKKQYEAGILKEVSDRTMVIHEEKGDLNTFMGDSKVDTNPDKKIQY